MPRDPSLKSILVIGSGPIVIGQAAEFDYSGTQATKALKEEGYEVILVNSNPATIMTDPEFADRTYVEPVTPEFVELVIEKERPDAILPTMGGQTALNVAMALAENGVLEKYGCELIGAKAESIRKAEDRKEFDQAISMDVGSVRLTEQFGDDPLEMVWTLRDELPGDLRPSRAIGVAGTILSLAALDLGLERFHESDADGHVLTSEAVHGLVKALSTLSPGERRELPPLNPKRAPFILAGAVILDQILRRYRLRAIEGSVRDLLDGAALEAAQLPEPAEGEAPPGAYVCC